MKPVVVLEVPSASAAAAAAPVEVAAATDKVSAVVKTVMHLLSTL